MFTIFNNVQRNRPIILEVVLWYPPMSVSLATLEPLYMDDMVVLMLLLYLKKTVSDYRIVWGTQCVGDR